MRSFKSGALLVLVGAGLAALTSGRQWISVSVSDEALQLTDLTFSGRQLLPAAHALEICALVLVLGMALTPTVARRVLAVVGIIVSVVAIRIIQNFLSDTSLALQDLIADAFGREIGPSSIRLDLWPVLAIIGLTIAVLGFGLIVTNRAPSRGLSSKYERDPNAFAANGQDGAELPNRGLDPAANPWSALDAGIDPTV